MPTTTSALQIDENIWLDTLGKIAEGTDVGHYIKIGHDPKQAKGYFIYQSSSMKFDSPETYDAWVQDIEHLKMFFKESKWRVLWMFDHK